MIAHEDNFRDSFLKQRREPDFKAESPDTPGQLERAEPDLFEVPGYELLRRVLDAAYHQSASGKGKERHANDLPFGDQPIMNIGRMVGLGGHAYQVCKKAQEAVSMNSRGEHQAAKAEFLGAIVYAAAAYILIEENESLALGE